MRIINIFYPQFVLFFTPLSNTRRTIQKLFMKLVLGSTEMYVLSFVLMGNS